MRDGNFESKIGPLLTEFKQASEDFEKTPEYKAYSKANDDYLTHIFDVRNVIRRHQAIAHYLEGSLPLGNVVWGELKLHDFRKNCNCSVVNGNDDTKQCDLFKEMEKIFDQHKEQAEKNRDQKLRDAYSTEAGRKYKELNIVLKQNIMDENKEVFKN